MKITIIAVIRNEITILPFWLRHYQRIADAIIVYDGLSDDGTREMLAVHPLVTLRDNDTGGLLDDGANIAIKNEVYKREAADWFLFPDADEFLYHPNFRARLSLYALQGITLPRIEGWDMIGDEIPPDTDLLTEHIHFGVRNPRYMDKEIIIRPCVDIRYEPGAHGNHAMGNVVRSAKADIKLLHYKWLSPTYVASKAATQRISNANVRNRWAYNDAGERSNTTWEAYYREAKEKRVKVI